MLLFQRRAVSGDARNALLLGSAAPPACRDTGMSYTWIAADCRGYPFISERRCSRSATCHWCPWEEWYSVWVKCFNSARCFTSSSNLFFSLVSLPLSGGTGLSKLCYCRFSLSPKKWVSRQESRHVFSLNGTCKILLLRAPEHHSVAFWITEANSLRLWIALIETLPVIWILWWAKLLFFSFGTTLLKQPLPFSQSVSVFFLLIHLHLPSLWLCLSASPPISSSLSHTHTLSCGQAE